MTAEVLGRLRDVCHSGRMRRNRGVTRTAAVVLPLLALATVAAPPAAAEGDLPPFASSVGRIDKALKERMVHSWHRGCPVPRRDLRYAQLSYVGFDGAAHQGELVLHEDVAEDVVGVFERIYELRFPIRRMRLVDDYEGSDARSMRRNNTSAFNCRRITGGSSWSEHSYGTAVDINPVQNPYVYRGTVQPAKGAPYVDRTPKRKGMVIRAVRRAFSEIGWSWGGTWTTRKDYQHFSQSGR
jgi:poly-gamma-glutamate synthesis protein (capsule biosynthesis protein)